MSSLSKFRIGFASYLPGAALQPDAYFSPLGWSYVVAEAYKS